MTPEKRSQARYRAALIKLPVCNVATHCVSVSENTNPQAGFCAPRFESGVITVHARDGNYFSILTRKYFLLMNYLLTVYYVTCAEDLLGLGGRVRDFLDLIYLSDRRGIDCGDLTPTMHYLKLVYTCVGNYSEYK